MPDFVMILHVYSLFKQQKLYTSVLTVVCSIIRHRALETMPIQCIRHKETLLQLFPQFSYNNIKQSCFLWPLNHITEHSCNDNDKQSQYKLSRLFGSLQTENIGGNQLTAMLCSHVKLNALLFHIV